MHRGPRLLNTRLKFKKNFHVKSLQSHDFNGESLHIITLEHAKLSLCLTQL